MSRYAGKRFAIGVSGGRDSICLLHVVINCGAVRRDDLLCVHVNHRLRDEADSDQAFVRLFCEKNNVPFKAFTVDVKAEGEKNGLTIEQAARNLRYGIFYDLIKSGAADLILTAHHALDNAETVLMHLFRGAGLDGLCGIKNGGDGITVRPFLSVMPSELDRYAAEFGIDYVVDKTNFIDDADRNFIRLNVIPLIEKRYAGAVRAVNALAAECGEATEFLDGAVDRSLISFDGGAVIVKDEALGTPLAARYVRKALEYYTLVDITREQVERVVALKNGRAGAHAELSNGVIAAREYGEVALYIPRPACNAVAPIRIGANFIDGLSVVIRESKTSPRSAVGRFVDLDKLDGSELRFRRDGDIFTPFGGKTKKLKQYFIDNKIPSRLRDRIPLVCRGGEVLVIVGYQIADSVKQTDGTTNRGEVFLPW